MSKEFDIKDLGKIKYCLGIDIKQTRNRKSMDQSGFIKELFSQFEMINCKPAGTPVALGTKLTVVSDNEKKDYPCRVHRRSNVSGHLRQNRHSLHCQYVEAAKRAL